MSILFKRNCSGASADVCMNGGSYIQLYGSDHDIVKSYVLRNKPRKLLSKQF